jgi:hypothetical protein
MSDAVAWFRLLGVLTHKRLFRRKTLQLRLASQLPNFNIKLKYRIKI